MKKILLILIPIILLAVAGYFYVYTKHVEVSAPQTETKPETLTKETDSVSVNVTYPIVPGAGTGISDANAQLRLVVDKQIASFEADVKESAYTGADLPLEIKSTVSGSPSIEERNDRYVAIFMGMEWYLRGAAHPSHSIDTYVYDYKKERLIVAKEFFKPGTAYLELLSKFSRDDLKAQEKEGDLGYVYDTDMVEEGTKPTVENFSRVLPRKDGLAIYFGEYQVAPYAAGPQQVVIPYAKLESVIDKEGVLGMYLNN